MSMMKIATAALVVLAAGGGVALAAGSGGGGMSSAPSDSAPAYDPTADYAHAVQALRDSQYKDAQRLFRRVTDAVPQSADAWRGLGMARNGLSDWKGARSAWERLVKLAPNDVGAHANLGMALANLKDPKAAAQLDWLKARSQACGAGCPDEAALKSAIGELDGALAGSAKPVARLQDQRRLRGAMIFAGAKAGDVAYSTAVSLINQHRYDEALATLAKAQAAFGPHPDILTYEGYAWRKKGDWTRAEGYYRQALAIAPSHRGATEYYGELKVERGEIGGARTLLAKLDQTCAYGCAEAEELRLWVDLGHDPDLR